MQARTYQSKLGFQEWIAVLLIGSDRPAQDDKQIGSRRRNRIQIIETDVDIAHVISGFDQRDFK